MAKSANSPAVRLDASMRVVVLRGPEEYLLRMHSATLIDALRAVHGEIEEFTFVGAVTEPAVLLDELRSYGLLQPHKLVILDNADQFLATKEETPDAAGPRAPAPARGRGAGPRPRRRKTTRELLEKYVAEPVESATLLMRAATWRPGKLDKLVAKVGAVVRCDPPNEDAAVRFCLRRCEKAHDATITREAAGRLVERAGLGLTRLDAELAKLAALVGKGGTIGPDEVRALVGLGREEQAWAVQSALLTGSPGRGVEAVRELLTISSQPGQLVIWSMIDLLRKLHAGGQLARQGVGSTTIARDLRLWGSGIEAVRRLDPDRTAQLLRKAVEADRDLKQGLGSAPRTLEALAVEIADTVGCA